MADGISFQALQLPDSKGMTCVWEIKNLPQLADGSSIKSPTFHLIKNNWYLEIAKFDEYFNIYLWREKHNNSNQISCKVLLLNKEKAERNEGVYLYRRECKCRCIWNHLWLYYLEDIVKIWLKFNFKDNSKTRQENQIRNKIPAVQMAAGLPKNAPGQTEAIKTPSLKDCFTETPAVQMTTEQPTNGPGQAEVTKTPSLKDFSKTWIENMQDLYSSGRQSDVKIKVGKQTFRAHKLILSTQSPVFDAMFQHSDMTENINGTVEIIDCAEETFKDFLFFIYTGKCDNLTPRTAISLYSTAEKYNVQQLKLACCSCLASDIPVDVVLDAVHLATLHDETEIMKKATQVFIDNTAEILSTDKWVAFMEESATLANALLLKKIRQRP